MFDASGKRFIRTGDVGRFDEDGFLVLLDRRKAMIISGRLQSRCRGASRERGCASTRRWAACRIGRHARRRAAALRRQHGLRSNWRRSASWNRRPNALPAVPTSGLGKSQRLAELQIVERKLPRRRGSYKVAPNATTLSPSTAPCPEHVRVCHLPTNESPMHDHPSQALAAFAAGLRFEDIPAPVQRRTEDLFLDWLGSGWPARGAPGAEPGRVRRARWARTQGPSEVLISRTRTSPLFAAMVNAAASHVRSRTTCTTARCSTRRPWCSRRRWRWRRPSARPGASCSPRRWRATRWASALASSSGARTTGSSTQPAPPAP